MNGEKFAVTMIVGTKSFEVCEKMYLNKRVL